MSTRVFHRGAIDPTNAPQPSTRPVVTVSAPTGVTDIAATLHGTANPTGAVTTAWFEYGPTNAYGSQTAPVNIGAGTAPVALAGVLGGLLPGSLVYWRLVASNAGGDAHSPDQTLITDTVPLAVVGQADAIDDTHATLHGSVNPMGADTLVHFDYGTTTAYGTSTAAVDIGAGNAPVAVSAILSGLTAGTTYHYRVVAVNAIGTSSTVDVSFATTTPALPPAVTESVADTIDASHATLHGTANPQGTDTLVHFEYGPTNAYGSSTAPVDVGSGSAPVAVSAPLSGLAGATTYHWRLVAVSAAGTTNGADQTFTTAVPPTAPAVSVAPADGIDTTHATLHGSVNPGNADTTWHFEYGPTNAYGSSTPSSTIPAAGAAVPVSAALSGLPVGATTHWRLVAVNTIGTTNSPDQTFATLPNPSRVTPLAQRRGVVQYQSPANNLDSRAIAAAKPWLDGVTIGARWNQVEAVRGVFDWGNAVASFADAYANGYFVLLRVVAGRYTPNHVFTTGGVPSVAIWSDPSVPGAADLKLPVFWNPKWQAEVQRFLTNGLMPLLKTKIPGTVGQGGSASDGSFVCGDLCLGVPIFIGADPGSEMWLNYNGDQARNQPAWDAVTVQGAYSSKLKARQAYMGQVWSAGIDQMVAALSGLCPALMAFGGVFFDSQAQAHAISKTKLGGANKDLVVGMHTDFIPNKQGTAPNYVIPKPPNDPWAIRDPDSALNLSQVHASGGAIGFQTASWSGGPNQYTDFADPSGTYQYGMQNDLLANWPYCRFVETQSNPFGIPALVTCLRDVVQPALVGF